MWDEDEVCWKGRVGICAGVGGWGAISMWNATSNLFSILPLGK